jgi:hypothetical protein
MSFGRLSASAFSGTIDTTVALASPFFLEAPVSIHNRGNWVADVDILSLFAGGGLTVLLATQCQGHQGLIPSEIAKEIVTHELVTIDSWEELLDTPVESAVIRAHGNWQARLAAAALSIQLGHETRVVPRIFCWLCYLNKKLSPGSGEAEEISDSASSSSVDEEEVSSDAYSDIIPQRRPL